MNKKELKKITVTTLPNGYSLQFDGQYKDGYMYFDVESLVAGMLKHVVMGDTSEQDPDICRNLMQSMMTWPEGSELHNANAKLLSDIENEHLAAIQSQRSLAKVNRQYDAVCAELRELKEKFYIATIQLDNYKKEQRESERRAEIERIRAQRKQTQVDIGNERKGKRVKVNQSDEQDEVVKKLIAERVAKARAAKAAKKAERETEKATAEQTPKTEKKPAEKPKKQAKPQPVEYSEAVYQALMTPLTIDRMNGISIRTLKMLKYAGGQINLTVGDVAKLSKKEMLMQRGCGTLVINEWQAWLDTHGLQMGMNTTKILEAHDGK